MKLATMVLLLCTTACLASPTYSELRNAESKKVGALFDTVAPHSSVEDDAYQKALQEHTEAQKRLSPALLAVFPKFTFGPDYVWQTDVIPNLFIRGDADSACYEGLHIELTKRGKKAIAFAGHLTNETLLREADEALSVQIPSWHREKGNGIANSPDATEVLTDIYCNGASHTQLKKLKNGLWVVAVTQDSAQRPTHLIGLRQMNEHFLFLRTELPKSFIDKLGCPKKARMEKAQIKCLSEELTDKMVEPHSKPLLQALNAFQFVN